MQLGWKKKEELDTGGFLRNTSGKEILGNPWTK